MEYKELISHIVEDINIEPEINKDLEMSFYEKQKEFKQIDNDVIKYIDNRINEMENQNVKRMKNMLVIKKKVNNRCFTCKPRGKIKKHVIGYSPCGQYLFHHDMNYRPIILVTPIQHITNIEEINDLRSLFKSIREFCEFWTIEDYKVSYNCGTWNKNEHFHIKIHIYEKTATRMRGDHFRMKKFEGSYKIDA